MQFRTEYKFICCETDLQIIEARVNRVLKPDKNGIKNSGKYHVHSLYFDDFSNSCIFENDAGIGERKKWRIRYYNYNFDSIFLEKKTKKNGLGAKKTSRLTFQQACSITENQFSKILWDSNDPLIKEFCIAGLTKVYKPKIMIDYERTAYVDPILNIRVTFDRAISCSKEIDKFFTSNNYTKYPLLPSDTNLLEIKYDYLLPSYIKQAVHFDGLCQTTFSKYYLCRQIIERN